MHQVGAAALPATPAGHEIKINDEHAKLGHCLEALVRKAVTRGGMPPCKECATGKGRQKDVVKESDHAPSEVLGECIFIDIATIKKKNNKDKGYSKMFWLLAADEYSCMKLFWFLNKKSELSGVMRDFVRNINHKIYSPRQCQREQRISKRC